MNSIKQAAKKVGAGRYIVAVSGGVDSSALLHSLARFSVGELIVAHVNHGIRSDSDADESLVRAMADQFNLPFISTHLQLKPDASEDEAREKRYAFLEKMKIERQAKAIILAHHQDDLIETALLNLRRGTYFRGLSALKSTDTRLRPFLNIPKVEIVAYATKHTLQWREDSTNADDRYARNWLRQNVMNKMNDKQRQKILHIINTVAADAQEIDKNLAESGEIECKNGEVGINRSWLITLPSSVRREVFMYCLRLLLPKHSVDRSQLNYLDLLVRTAKSGTRHAISNTLELNIKNAKVLVNAKT